MFVIAIVLMLLIGVQVSASQTIVNAAKRAQATAYANEAMEVMRALPWDTLSRGNVPGFQAAGGTTDPYYAGNNTAGNVTIDGATYTVRLAITNPQDLSTPRPPLFDASGSNLQVLSDPARPGIVYNVRSYIVNSLASTASSVGLLVIVSWENVKTGQMDDLALRSSAYPGSDGCGDTAEMPYLTACQDRMTFASTSGYLTTSLNANVDGSPTLTPLLEGTDVQDLSMRSSYVTATGDSVQVSTVSGEARRGGVTVKHIPVVPTAPSVLNTSGYQSFRSEATNNFAVATGVPANSTVALGATSSTATSDGGGGLWVGARSDDTNSGSSRSNVSTACDGVQLLAGEPCSFTTLSGSGGLYTSLSLNSNTLYAAYRASSTTATAGGGRFASTSPGANYGCSPLVTSGCTSARATYNETLLRFGYLSSGAWNEGPTSLVEIADYSDSVLVQRGANQMSTAATMSRTATIRYWNGSSMVTSSVNASSTGDVATTAPVTWSAGGGLSVTAQATVSATPVSSQVLGEDPVVDCTSDTCAATATAGSLTVSIRYTITSATSTWNVNQATVLSSSSATASYDRRTP